MLLVFNYFRLACSPPLCRLATATDQVQTHHYSVFFFACKFSLVDVIEAVRLGVLRLIAALVLAELAEWMCSKKDNEISSGCRHESQ